MDHSQPMHGAVVLGEPAASRAVNINRVGFIEIGHRTIPVGDIANLADGRDVALHRVDRRKADELRPPRLGAPKAVFEVDRVVMAEFLTLGPAVLVARGNGWPPGCPACRPRYLRSDR